MFRYLNILFIVLIILHIQKSSANIVEKIEKFSIEFKLHAAVDSLISQENPEEIEEVKAWLEKNLETLKLYINSEYVNLIPLKRYFNNKWAPRELYKLSSWKKLIENGADPNINLKYINSMGLYSCSLLHLCAIDNNIETAKFLKKYNINIDAKDNLGRTALHVAILNNSQEIINFLIIDCQADLNIQDDSGKTPLHMAVERNNIQTISLLKIYNANLEIKDFRKKTPLKLAILKKNLEAINILNPILHKKIIKKSHSCAIV